MGGPELLPGLRPALDRRRSDPGAADAGRDRDRAEQGAKVLWRRQSHRPAADVQLEQEGADLPRHRRHQGPSADDRPPVRLPDSPGDTDSGGEPPMAQLEQQEHHNLSAVCDASAGQGHGRRLRKLHRSARGAVGPVPAAQGPGPAPDAAARDTSDRPAGWGDRRGHWCGGGPDPAAGGGELCEPRDGAGVDAGQGGGAT